MSLARSMGANSLFRNTGVLQNVLTDVRVHLEDAVGGAGFRRSVRMGAIALLVLRLRH